VCWYCLLVCFFSLVVFCCLLVFFASVGCVFFFNDVLLALSFFSGFFLVLFSLFGLVVLVNSVWVDVLGCVFLFSGVFWLYGVFCNCYVFWVRLL